MSDVQTNWHFIKEFGVEPLCKLHELDFTDDEVLLLQKDPNALQDILINKASHHASE